MKKRVANKLTWAALTGVLFIVLCLAPAVQMAGDHRKGIGGVYTQGKDRSLAPANPQTGRPSNQGGAERVDPLLPAGLRSSLVSGGAMLAQGKGDGVLAPDATYTFNNSSPIAINDFAAASPYPSNIHVTQVPDTIFRVVVSLSLIQHTNPDDLDILLVGPQGQNVLLMSDAGGATDIISTTLTFDDAAGSFLPDSAAIASGTYKPTNYGAGEVFPAPAPAGPYSSTLSAFAGTNANGFWNLYVFDDMGGGNVGAISGGWSLTIETLTVTSVNDSGPGTLRQAILNANSNADLSTISFRFAGTGPFEISPSSPLPAITAPVILDATTQSGYAGTPLVQINGLNAGGNGLTITSGGSTIKGLGIVAFSGTGILLDPGGGNTIQGCYIGLNVGGQIVQPNGGHGIDMGPTSANNLIGGTTAAARNVISGNGQYGIVLGSSGQVVQGNYIGTNAAGTAAVGNAAYGIGIFGISMTIGGTTAGARNVISGNGNRGILITGVASNITVQGNYIGTSASGTADLGNLEDGILINGTSFNTIGGTTAAARNVISGNNQNGIAITGAATGNLIYGNYIGTDATGTFAIGNSSDGVEINGASNATVGDTVAGARNVISGNGGNGIYMVNASGNTVQGNFIGTNANGDASVGNVMTGIFMEVSDNNLIGGTTAAARNVISGNSQYGIVLGSSGQVVQGNYIGTDFTGTLDLGNARDGIAMFGFNAQVGGNTAGERNVISGNNENGIQIAGSAAGNTIAGNYIGVGANGQLVLGNEQAGVRVSGASNNTIGGATPGAGNTIAFNAQYGVFVVGATGITIRGNSIYGNTSNFTSGLGIDLSPDGVAFNDVGDGDAGSNNLQNFPTLFSAVPGGGGTVITGTFNSTANTSFTVEFFSSQIADSLTYGEGQLFIGSATVTTNGNGDAPINYTSATIVPVGHFITATATRNSAPLDTSEFSRALRVTSALCGGVNTTVINTDDSGPGSLRQAILNANATVGVKETICFNLTGTTIYLSSALPAITDPVIIDGTTQPGFPGTPIVELSGVGAGAGANGLAIAAGSSTVKGLVINYFSANGILIQTNGGNTIQGCLIGTDPLGVVDRGNEIAGVNVDGTSSNTIGGTTPTTGNLISGNHLYGVYLGPGATGNLVQGNYIGTNVAGTAGIGNALAGVGVQGSNNTIGGATTGARNIISGNGGLDGFTSGYGVGLLSGATNNVVSGNYIGTQADGTTTLGNFISGVLISGAASNTIGGTTAGAGNLISGNSIGVSISNATLNQIQGNLIGTTASGNAALGNSSGGIKIDNASNNTIGGTTFEARNLISGNGNDGILMVNNSTGNLVEGNYIGTNAAGTNDLGNTLDGVAIQNCANNQIGGTLAGAGNVISGNNSDGIQITGTAPGNLIQGNTIGTAAAGTAAVGNSTRGVFINGGVANTIGGTAAGARNVISGNTIGVEIFSTSVADQNNLIQGNYIGTSASGTAAVGNEGIGVFINGGVANTVGGTAAGARNLISGNGAHGVRINGITNPIMNGAVRNFVQGNYIGTDAAGTSALGNTIDGVYVGAFAGNNTIGGATTAARNVISGNIRHGVQVEISTTLLQGNYIGTDAAGTAPLGNLFDGVVINSAESCTIDGNRIAYNGDKGVAIIMASTIIQQTPVKNAILSNSIHSNAGLGIDLAANGVTLNDNCDGDNGFNNLQNFPVITTAITSGGTTTIEGTLNSTANTSFTIQFFSTSAADPTGYGEGQSFIGSTTVMTNASCNASFTFNPASAIPAGSFITATATDANNNTSEFSQSRQVAPPTAVEFAGAAATGFDDGVLLQWQTGMEVDNLGFNLYREEARKQTRLNSQLLAGSALTVGPGVMIRSGFSYSWWDDKPANQEARYWIEDVDLNGLSAWHGPFYAKPVSGKAPAHAQALSLTQVGRTHDAVATHSLEGFAPLAKVTKDVALAALLQQADLAASRAIKVAVKRAGWYRLSQAELVDAGLDSTTDPRRLRLFVDGFEIPISVIGESDGNFDATDAVEFYGLGLNTPATDTRIYWLTTGAQPGLRINKAPFAKGDLAGESFACTIERRDRSIYFAALKNGDEENFFGAVVTAGAVEQKLTINNLARQATERAVLEVSLQGVTHLAHQVRVSLNGSPVGHLAFSGQAKGQQKTEISPALLREGENIVTFESSGTPGDVSLVDFIRLTYPGSYRAENDRLNCTAKSGQVVTITGFSSKDIRVFDVTDESRVEELSVFVDPMKDGYTATVTAGSGRADATNSGARQLLALTNEKALPASNMTVNSPANLRADGADFIIITRSELAESAVPLVALRRAQGYSLALIDVADIYDEFSFGEKSPDAVKDFLAFAASVWKQKPRFLLFAGDASYDPRNYLGFGDLDLVPTRLIDTDFMETASDDWFSDFSGDGIGEIATGRLPARTAAELTAMVAKIIAYEQSAPGDEALLVADANDGYDFEKAAADLRSLMPSSLKITQVNRGQLDTEMARRSLFEALYRKPMLVNYLGHGSVNQWRANLLTNEDSLTLRNDHLPFFVMMSCLNGYLQHPAMDSLGESLLKTGRGGAVAVWASSGMTMPEGQTHLSRELYRSLFSRRPAIALGEAIRAAKATITQVDIRRTWILLGDPAIRLK